MKGCTLGLDIGSKSIGWALIGTESSQEIVAMGVRVFPEGVDRDTKGMEKSKNATRREARGVRRTHQRRRDRKRQLIRTLRNAGLLPHDRDELASLLQSNPYGLRKRGLDEKLDLYAFGRALYHLAQRRGFKSNRKSGKASEDGPVMKGANALQAEMDAAGCRTVGEYFAGLNPEEQRIRGRYTYRSMYQREFDLLWAMQAQHRPSILTEELRQQVHDRIIFFQRPLKPADDLIGDCELEPSQKRCPRGDWYALHFRILQDVNNLVIQNADGRERKLTDEERAKLLSELSRKAKVSFSEMRKTFGLLETQRFNLEQDGKKADLKGNPFVAGMRSKNAIGPKRWDAMAEEEKIKLNTWLIELEDDELGVRLTREYDLEDAEVSTMLKISLPRGYMRFSRAAIMRLLPLMEAGKLTSEAKRQVYGDAPRVADTQPADALSLPPSLRNPIVQKALYEVRKVVNGVVREYGKPARIKIEMARDVAGSRQQREELHWKQLENERRNDEVRKRLREDIGIVDPTRDDVIKYKLWDECNRICPYTGKPMDQSDVFGSQPTFQIEHILPYDRSLDDSYMNKTLCDAAENIHAKKNQTPYEAYGHDAERFEQILERVNKAKMPYAKRRRFWQQETDLDKQIERELNDTRFICAEVVRYLKQLGVPVQGTRGKITSELRHQWGLDGIFSELGVHRDEDHRRHAVDALIVAVTDNGHLRRLAVSKYAISGARFPMPWPAFRDHTREKVRTINVSHRVGRKVSGALHEETNYGPTGLKDGKGQPLYVYRKKLEDMTIPMVERVVDPVVRGIIRQRLESYGVDLGGSGKPPKEVWREPLYMRTVNSDKQVPIKKVRIKEVGTNLIPLSDASGTTYRAVAPGSNHHIEIFEYTDENGRTRREGRVITMFEAIQRSRRGQSVVQRDYGDGRRFVCSAAINELFLLHTNEGKEGLYRVQKISGNQQIFFRQHAFGGDLRQNKAVSKYPNTLAGSKVCVDPIGRIHPAHD